MRTLFIGLGTMGAPMASSYARAGHTLHLYDAGPSVSELAASLGAVGLGSLAEMPDDIDVVLLMLPNSRIVEDVLVGTAGLLPGLNPGALIVDMGSSEPASTARLAKEAAERSIGYVDAPVSGGRAKAIDASLTFLVGGSTEDVARARPHLEPMAGAIFHVGPAGAGHAAKALNNMLSAANLAAAAEVLSAAVRYGIDPAIMVSVINASTGRSQATEVKYPSEVLTGAWASGFAFDLMLKDLRIARSLIESSELFAPITETVMGVVESARDALGSGLDHTELARFYEEQNALRFRAEQ